MTSSETQPPVDKEALFRKLLGVRYPMAPDPLTDEQEQAVQAQKKKPSA